MNNQKKAQHVVQEEKIKDSKGGSEEPAHLNVYATNAKTWGFDTQQSGCLCNLALDGSANWREIIMGSMAAGRWLDTVRFLVYILSLPSREVEKLDMS